jgi:hypothetical protein
MNRKGKPPFDPQVFLAKKRRRTRHFRLSEGSNRVQAGRSFGFRFLHSERQGQEDRRVRAGGRKLWSQFWVQAISLAKAA